MPYCFNDNLYFLLNVLLRMNPDPFLRHTFWTISTGIAFNWITQLGIQPGVVQRFIALPTYNQARKSLIYFVFGFVVITLLTGTIGMLIYAKYKDCDPVMANVSVYFTLNVEYFNNYLLH